METTLDESLIGKPDGRNVIDYYKYWREDAIKADLNSKRKNYSVLVSNKMKDFNLGTIIRNSNAFLAQDVILYGRRGYDKRSTIGTHLYSNLKHLRYVEEFDFSQYVVVGIDNNVDAVPIETFDWKKVQGDKHLIMIFGQEDIGIPDELMKVCNYTTYITQYGSTRSLNVGTASGIAMFSYCLNETR